jgi:hypothetical protein
VPRAEIDISELTFGKRQTKKWGSELAIFYEVYFDISLELQGGDR